MGQAGSVSYFRLIIYLDTSLKCKVSCPIGTIVSW